MAVIGRSENGFLVDHKSSISEAVSKLSLSCKDSLFALFEPYFRSSVANNSGTRKRKRKKSVKADPTEEDKDAAICHQKIRETIAAAVDSLVRIGMDSSYFLSRNEDTEQGSVVPPDKNVPSEEGLLGRMISHLEEEPALLSICGQQYILPAKCTFLMSDASNFKLLVDHAQQNGLYNLLVLDPPWFNKSARRGSKYSFMSLWQIKSLPVPQLLAPGALVGIWVTNKQKYLRFTKSELFPHWSVELVAEWYWVKVTRRGELVTDLDSPHKKPYEPLLIGRFKPTMFGLRTSCLNLIKDSEFDKEKMESNSKRSKWNELSPQMKRKRLDECDIKYCICDAGEKVTKVTHEWMASTSKSVAVIDLNHTEFNENKHAQLHNFLQNVASKNSNQHCLNCQKLVLKSKVDLPDKMKNLSDVDDQIQKEQSLQEFAELEVNKWVSKSGADLNLEKSDRATVSRHKPSESPEDSTLEVFDVLPYHQVICSVPCKVHSSKPPLNEIFSRYIPPHSLCLEMFARNLTPHWTSWGNEVLKFQSMEYFEQFLPNEKGKQKLSTD